MFGDQGMDHFFKRTKKKCCTLLEEKKVGKLSVLLRLDTLSNLCFVTDLLFLACNLEMHYVCQFDEQGKGTQNPMNWNNDILSFPNI